MRTWLPTTGECKGVLRGHDHVVECIAFANAESKPYIGELLAGDKKDVREGRLICQNAHRSCLLGCAVFGIARVFRSHIS